MASFQMTGSLVLLLFGLKMILGKVVEEAAALPVETTLFQAGGLPPGGARHRRRPAAILTVVLLTDKPGYGRSAEQVVDHGHSCPLHGR